MKKIIALMFLSSIVFTQPNAHAMRAQARKPGPPKHYPASASSRLRFREDDKGRDDMEILDKEYTREKEKTEARERGDRNIARFRARREAESRAGTPASSEGRASTVSLPRYDSPAAASGAGSRGTPASE